MNWLKRLIYHFFHGWHSVYPPLDPKAVNGGTVPYIYRQWLAEVAANLTTKARGFYHDQMLNYNYVRFEDVVQHVMIVDSIPGNPYARGTMHRDGPGQPVTMTLTKDSMNNEIYVKHELVHGLQYLFSELFGDQKRPGQYPGDHWPLIFDPYGTH